MKPIDLLYQCFKLTRRPSVAVRPSKEEEPVWTVAMCERLIQVAEQALVLPALHARLVEGGKATQLPSEVANALSAVEELNRERNHAIFTELAAVSALLNTVGIEPVLLKGVAYCITGVYENVATRYIGDVDLLIPKAQLSTAVDMLSQNGFEWDHNDRLGQFRHHHPPLGRPGSVVFELHHSLGMGRCKALLSASEVLAQSVGRKFRGARIRVPAPDHLMIHLIMHSQIQHRYIERIWPPLRAMYDLLLMQRRFDKELDWKFIQRRFRTTGQFGVLAMHLVQVRDVLDTETPFPVRLTGMTYCRWVRRKLLRAIPALRFVDPLYMFSTVFILRLRVLRSALATRNGWKHILRELSLFESYKRFGADFTHKPR